jgi:Cof subfamily protein (haloacid dehalogenase superfamily)
MKLLVFDIDNTILVRGDEHLTKEVANTISACLNKGYAVCFASGRPFTGVKKYLDEVGKGLKFAITANGAALYKEDGTLIKEVYMTPSECYKLHDEYQNSHCSVYAYDDYGGLITFSDDHWTKYELEVNNFNKHYEFDKEDYRNSNVKIYKVMIADDEEYSKNFSLTKEELKIYNPSRSTVNYYEVLRYGAGKVERILDLVNYLKIKEDDVYTFGDNNNDTPMLARFTGIALGNALDECKRVAKYITKDVKEDGVAYAIKEMLKLI